MSVPELAYFDLPDVIPISVPGVRLRERTGILSYLQKPVSPMMKLKILQDLETRIRAFLSVVLLALCFFLEGEKRGRGSKPNRH